jgi:quercetin dioxygenase-like cupin family protein
MDKNETLQNSTIFPLGTKIEQNFVGDAWLELLLIDPEPLHAPIANVTFAPRGRNNWHSHDVGQVLLVTGGEGWYQEEGKDAKLLKKGDVINIPSHVKHWHGATKDSWFVHLAITPGNSNWFEEVDDEWYDQL